MKTTSPSPKEKLPEPSAKKTGGHILDVAEQLFAEHGLERVSVRDIIGAAGVNLGAINYHFGTKQNLIAAIFKRRLTPLDAERLRLLDASEKSAGTKAAKLEDVLEAFIRPAVQHAMDPKQGSAAFRKMMARCFMEANPELEALLHSHFEPVIRRFDAALMRAMPELKREELFWRMHMSIGVLHHTLMMLDKAPPGAPKIRTNIEECTRQVVAFAAAGFRATGTATK